MKGRKQSDSDSPYVDLQQLRWLVSHGSSLLYSDHATPTHESLVKFVKKCREPWQRLMLEQQLQFRQRARKRFPKPEMWLWTDRSLSQASDWWCATFKAQLFPQNVTVVDACSGAGADAVALAQRSKVVCYDIDPGLNLLAEYNARNHSTEITTHCDRIMTSGLKHVDWLHLDPDRRPAERKTTRADQFSPSIDEALELSSKVVGSIIKLAPSTQFMPEVESLIDSSTSRVWLGNQGECRQQLLLTGALVLEDLHSRQAVLCEPYEADESSRDVFRFSGTPVHYECITDETRKYIYDLHPTLHAAELQITWASQHGMEMLGSAHGFATSSQLHDSPWCQGFEVLEILPWDDRHVRRWLRKREVGVVEVKSRLVKLDANHFQRRYSGPGGETLTLIVTQFGGRVRAIATKRIEVGELIAE